MGFKLKTIGDGRQKAPVTRVIKVTFTANTTLAEGDVLTVSYGAEGNEAASYAQTVGLAKMTHETTGIGVFVVAEAASLTANTAGTVRVFDILPDMVFVATAGADLTSCVPGIEYKLTSAGKVSDSQTGHGAHHTVRGVILCDNDGASADGKKVLVKFPVA